MCTSKQKQKVVEIAFLRTLEQESLQQERGGVGGSEGWGGPGEGEVVGGVGGNKGKLPVAGTTHRN